MKRVCVLVLLAVGLLIPACSSQAADLQAGWYVTLRSLYVYDGSWPGFPVGDGVFLDEPGTYGPYQVTADPLGNWYTRTVRVPTTTYGVQPGISVDLPLNFGNVNWIERIDVWWKTNYDASQMRLQFLHTDLTTGATTVLWEQNQSGVLEHTQTLAYGTPSTGLMFRVVAVPEPSAAVSLLIPISLTGLAFVRRRARRCA